jgi:hypothetical protein
MAMVPGGATAAIEVGLGEAYRQSLWANYKLFEDYYAGVHPAAMISQAELNDPELGQFWRPVNIAKIVVDEPVGYITATPVALECSEPEVKLWAEDWMRRHLRPRLGELIRYQGTFGTAYGYLWTDYQGQKPGLKLEAIPPVQAGRKRLEADFTADDAEEITRAHVHYWQHQETTDAFIRRRLEISREQVAEYQLVKGAWVRVSGGANPFGLIPVAALRNEGPSDLTDVIPLQDDLNSLWFDLRQAWRYQAHPLLAADADPGPGFKVGPRRILSGDNIRRLEAGDLSQLMAAEARVLSRAALVARSRALAQEVGGRVDMPAEALRILGEAFEARVQAKAERLADFLEELLTLACRMLARDPALYELVGPQAEGRPVSREALERAEFSAEMTVRLPADENKRRDSVSMARRDGVYSQRAALRALGHSEQQAQQIFEESLEEAALLDGGVNPRAAQEDPSR